MKTKMKNTRKLLLGTILALAAPFALPTAVRAADHGDGPTASNDQACDIADVFFFLDPNDNSKAVLIATFRGFIVPSEAVNFGIFDPNVRYRFQIENNGNANPDRTIDVTFSPKVSSAPQTASIKISGLAGKFSAPATAPTLAGTPNPQIVTDLQNAQNNDPGIEFFAGEVDDPFFFDIPAFNGVVASILGGAPNPGLFARSRDSFAGYNIMSIAFKVPVSLLRASGAAASTTIGVNFLTQRHTVQTPGRNGITTGTGAFRNIDRMGNAGVNVALIPFAQKNKYNAGSLKDDKNLKFAPFIKGTVDALVLGLGRTQAEADAVLGVLASVAVAGSGDMLRLQTDATIAPNAGTGGGTGPNGFPNGRRLRDDTIDFVLGTVAGGVLGDGVAASDVAPTNAFPFLAPPQQPRPNGTVEDNTRN